MKIKIYCAVVESKGDCFTVNGGWKTDRDEAIRVAKQHVAFRDPETKIIRVDEQDVNEAEFFKPSVY